MLKRKFLQVLVTTLISGAGVIAAAQPAQAASVTIPPGASGNACSAYQHITSTVYFQACAWASGGSTPRVWFTGHFGNTGSRAVTLPFVDLSYYRNGVYQNCGYEAAFEIPAGGVKATDDYCYVPRRSSAYQAVVMPRHGTRDFKQLSPTIQVQ